jgi:hypothetical protein
MGLVTMRTRWVLCNVVRYGALLSLAATPPPLATKYFRLKFPSPLCCWIHDVAGVDASQMRAPPASLPGISFSYPIVIIVPIDYTATLRKLSVQLLLFMLTMNSVTTLMIIQR